MMQEQLAEPTVDVPLSEHVHHVIQEHLDGTVDLEQEVQDTAIRDTQAQVSQTISETEQLRGELYTLKNELETWKMQQSEVLSILQEMKQKMETVKEEVSTATTPQKIAEEVPTEVQQEVNDAVDRQEAETKQVEADMQPIAPEVKKRMSTGMFFRHPTMK